MKPEQLEWFRKDDLTQATRCGRYEIKRTPNHENYPAQTWEYAPKCIADPDRVIGAGKYDDSKFARAACQDDLDQQQRRVAATTEGRMSR